MFTVGVTGSVGKTSTKEMIYSILSQRGKTLKTEGNFNNEIGMPMTMFHLSHEYVNGVFEKMCIRDSHSLEDRMVKHRFQSWCRGCTCPPEFPVCVCGNKPKADLVNRKPITASEKELSENRRSTSAKLRILQKR